MSYSTSGSSGNETVPTQARGCAVANTYWVGLAVPANSAAGVASGMIDPRGNWAVGGPGNSTPAIAVTDLHGVDVSLIGRNFRRRTRARMGS